MALNIGPRRVISLSPSKGGGAYSAEAQALFARFTTPPDQSRKALINTMVVALKAAGVWGNLDALWIFAAADQQAGRQNWIADQFNATTVSSPAFTTDRGYQGDGATSYLNLGLNLTTGGLKTQRNANAAGVYVRTDSLSATSELGGSDFSIGANQSGGSVSMRNASTTADTQAGPAPSSVGLWSMLRNNGTDFGMLRNGVLFSSKTRSSAAFSSQVIFACGRNSGSGAVSGSTRQVSAAYAGNLTEAQTLSLYTALLSYLQSVGAA